jgi:hypothetical protein
MDGKLWTKQSSAQVPALHALRPGGARQDHV